MHTEDEIDVYTAPRGEEFKSFILQILSLGDIKDIYKNFLVNETNLNLFSNAFTAKSAHLTNNFEVYEQLGDLCVNKFIVFYMYKRFPKLNCSEGVKVVARLRINYGARNSFFNFANNLGFWKFISASTDDRNRRMKPLMEDVFEAFFGCVESIIDSHFINNEYGLGYRICCKILKNIFDQIPISLKYEDLYDAKTRLKELFDHYPNEDIGNLVYKEHKTENMITISNVFRLIGTKQQLIGTGSASLKADAQQKAAAQALLSLERINYIKPPPEIYSLFSSM